MENFIGTYGGGGSIDPSSSINLNDYIRAEHIGIYSVEPYSASSINKKNIPNNYGLYQSIHVNKNQPKVDTIRYEDIRGKYRLLDTFIDNEVVNKNNKYWSAVFVVAGDITKTGFIVQYYYRVQDGILWYRQFKDGIFTIWYKLTTDYILDLEILANKGDDGSLISLKNMREALRKQYRTTGTFNPEVVAKEINEAIRYMHTGEHDITKFIRTVNPILTELDMSHTEHAQVLRYKQRRATDQSIIYNNDHPVLATIIYHDRPSGLEYIDNIKPKMKLRDGDSAIVLGSTENNPITLAGTRNYAKILVTDGEHDDISLKPLTDESENIYMPEYIEDGNIVTLPDYIIRNNYIFTIRISEFGKKSTSTLIGDTQNEADRTIKYSNKSGYVVTKGTSLWKTMTKKIYSECIDILGKGTYYLSYYNHKITRTPDVTDDNLNYYLDRNIRTKQTYLDNDISDFYVSYGKGDIKLIVEDNQIRFELYDGLSQAEKTKLMASIKNFTIEIFNLIGGRL